MVQMLGSLERGCAWCFAAETFQGIRIFGRVLRQEFRSNEPAQFRVLSLVDHAHTAGSQFFENPVARDGLSGRGVGLSHPNSGPSGYKGILLIVPVAPENPGIPLLTWQSCIVATDAF